MEILKFVEKNVRKRSILFWFWIAATLLIFFLMFQGIVFVDSSIAFKSDKNLTNSANTTQSKNEEQNILQNVLLIKMIKKIDNRIWYFLEFMSALGIIYIWFYYAPIFYKKLNDLEHIFGGNKAYAELYKHYRQWSEQFEISFRTSKKSFFIKLFYMIAWGTFFGLITYYSYNCFSDVISSKLIIAILEVLMMSLIFLNFSSYYSCVVFVYFVMRVFNLARKDELEYVKELPSTTYGFQELKNTADIIYIYFLLDSGLCTFFYICFIGVVPIDSYSYFYNHPKIGMFEVAFLAVNGLISWVGIALLLRTYLYKLHDCWKNTSLKAYQKRYNKIAYLMEKRKKISKKNQQKLEEVTRLMNQLVQDKMTINKWEFITSLATLIGELATAGITLDIIIKMFSF